jgi:N-acetyl-gamma-glutamyl-phosphate reductase
LKAAIIGASGYTGAELMRILWSHPAIGVEVAFANQYAGHPIGSLYPSLAGCYSGDFRTFEPGALDGCDIVFSCLPHGESMKAVAQAIDMGLKVIDLSADFRLTADEYLEWYGTEHLSEGLLDEAVYGLPELNRSEIAGARLVANPGCYPTSAILGLAPVAPLIEGNVIIDAKSGVSGAGRKLTLGTHFPQVSDGISPYGVSGHRHAPEIRSRLASLAGRAVNTVFTPHLAPMNRGILCTMYVQVGAATSIEKVRSLYMDAYGDEPFVRVLPAGDYPQTKATQGSNNCHLALEMPGGTGVLVVMSAIDNLVKGASGQAVQSANIMCGLDEVAGLDGPGLFP